MRSCAERLSVVMLQAKGSTQVNVDEIAKDGIGKVPRFLPRFLLISTTYTFVGATRFKIVMRRNYLRRKAEVKRGSPPQHEIKPCLSGVSSLRSRRQSTTNRLLYTSPAPKTRRIRKPKNYRNSPKTIKLGQEGSTEMSSDAPPR